VNHQPAGPGYRRGDRIALERTTDPYTRLTPGTQGTVTGYDPQHGQLHVAWDDGSTLSMLPGEGDQVRIVATSGEGFQAAFLINPGPALAIDYQSYTTEVDPGDLFDEAGNFTDPAPIDISAADAALADAGYSRVTDWNYTDDIWGAVIRRTSSSRPGRPGGQGRQ